MLCRLTYVSEAQITMPGRTKISVVQDILSSSRKNNAAANITGALAYDGVWFYQILEGDRSAVWKTFLRISEDARHDGCLLIEMTEVSNRLFGNWWMGFVQTRPPLEHASPLEGATIVRPYDMTSAEIAALMTHLAGFGASRGSVALRA